MSKLVHGHGINDAKYNISPRVGRKREMCPFYQKWVNMIYRCYSPKFHKNNPTYIGCTVCDEWLSFMAFRGWMMAQDWQGMELDKDIIIPDNKMYSPDTCCFIPKSLNNLMTDSASTRGKLAKGVHCSQHGKMFIAQCRHKGKQKYLGSFDTEAEASAAYLKRKREIITETANEQANPRIRDGLLLHAMQI